MAKKILLVLMIGVVAIALSGCLSAAGTGMFGRAWRHIEWHILGAYKDIVNIHKDIDKFIFNLDERNPDRY